MTTAPGSKHRALKLTLILAIFGAIVAIVSITWVQTGVSRCETPAFLASSSFGAETLPRRFFEVTVVSRQFDGLWPTVTYRISFQTRPLSEITVSAITCKKMRESLVSSRRRGGANSVAQGEFSRTPAATNQETFKSGR